jgi:hypothetical protein
VALVSDPDPSQLARSGDAVSVSFEHERGYLLPE